MTATANGVTLSCYGSLDFNITQSGTTFSGVEIGTGRMTCSSQGQTVLDDVIGGETIVGGQINGTSVTFRLGSISGQHTATVTGTSMTGTAQWVLSDGSTSITLSGQFTGAKTS